MTSVRPTLADSTTPTGALHPGALDEEELLPGHFTFYDPEHISIAMRAVWHDPLRQPLESIYPDGQREAARG
jgi:hypothetical protein